MTIVISKKLPIKAMPLKLVLSYHYGDFLRKNQGRRMLRLFAGILDIKICLQLVMALMIS